MMSRFESDLEIHGRERVIFQTIRDNPKLHHNALLKIIVPKYMAKTTFEKTRDLLLDREVITVENRGNMKFYFVTIDYEEKFQQRIEKNTVNSFHDLKLEIKKLDVDFSHKDIDDKITTATAILKNLIHVDNGFTILDSVKNPKRTLYRDEHLEIQQSLHHLLKIIKNDKEYDVVFPAVASMAESLFSTI